MTKPVLNEPTTLLDPSESGFVFVFPTPMDLKIAAFHAMTLEGIEEQCSPRITWLPTGRRPRCPGTKTRIPVLRKR